MREWTAALDAMCARINPVLVLAAIIIALLTSRLQRSGGPLCIRHHRFRSGPSLSLCRLKDALPSSHRSCAT